VNQIEAASKLGTNPAKLAEMLAILHSLAAELAQPPATLAETAFIRQFGAELSASFAKIDKYQATGDPGELHSAWKTLTQVFAQIKAMIPHLTKIQTDYASQQLSELADRHLIVPTTYEPNSPLVRIREFGKVIKIVNERGRPRKLSMIGGNGEKYSFLLTSQTDTRLDERFMQLFSVVNKLVKKTGMELQIAKVLPVNARVGLVRWLPHRVCLEDIVRESRKKLGGDLDQEVKSGGEFAKLISLTPGDEIEKYVLWGSANLEKWIERRSNFTKSLASTSMVGYVIGLGNRHLRNIQIDPVTARLNHRDFSECFEAALHRAKFAETVPFRLTRILTNALEISGVSGTFRSSSVLVLKAMKKEDEQILGLLDVFVSDPILPWMAKLPLINRAKQKLSGTDPGPQKLKAVDQVAGLIQQATSPDQLMRMWRGWMPWC
jgi:FKBP12-rapamycin complex-associated protein